MASVPAPTGGGPQVFISQSHSAKFVDKSRSASVPALSPLADADLQKSGNPGYINGYNVRAGLVTNSSDSEVIRVLRQGPSLDKGRPFAASLSLALALHNLPISRSLSFSFAALAKDST